MKNVFYGKLVAGYWLLVTCLIGELSSLIGSWLIVDGS